MIATGRLTGTEIEDVGVTIGPRASLVVRDVTFT
jgi:hypothetical protein